MSKGGTRRGEDAVPLIATADRPSDEISSDDDPPQLYGSYISNFFSSVFPNYGANASLERAWKYFERIVLPRRMPDGKGGYTKAPPGTTTTRTTLYPAWTTPQRELRDFGTGIAVYFETLRALVVICFVAGLLYYPSIRYYQSDAYSSNQKEQVSNLALRGSLMCPSTAWVPCPTCPLDEWEAEPHRFATTEDGTFKFILKNECAPLRWQEGANHLVVLVFLIVAVVALGYHQTKLELQYDEDILTASDFSIVVQNPPDDATDIEEWKEFFSQFGNVVYCTVALDNDELVKALAKRRGLLQKASFKWRGEHGEAFLQEVPESLRLHKKIKKSEEKCSELLKKKYTTSGVFVTFETERGQRQALQDLTVSKISIATNDTSALPSDCLFRGNLVLDVLEASEPSVIRWEDLNTTVATLVLQRILTGFITLGLIALGFFAVREAFAHSVNLAAILIAILNIAVPNLFKLVNGIESHSREGSFQASLYAKISIFRFINTAVVTTMIKPFTATISSDADALIPAVYAVLKAEICTAPILHMCDIVGHVKRLILAPRAANQAAMDSHFRGSRQQLGEKYTNMTKIIFLCFFYSVVFPSSFFFGAVAIAATYVTDKFLLLRSWAQPPELGDDVAKLSRRFFFPFTLVVLAIMSEFYWSAYPFDNACEADMVVSSDNYPEYIGSHTIRVDASADETFQVMLTGDGSEKVYRFCDQDYVERLSALFRFFQEEKDDWMSEAQQTLTFLFGIFCVAILAIVGIIACIRDIMPQARDVVVGDYSTFERDSGEYFSEQAHIKAYVPQLGHRLFSYPLILCDIRETIDTKHIGWTDALHDHEFYSLANDVRFLLHGKEPASPVLSRIQYWPSKSVLAETESNEQRKGYGSF